MPSTSLLKVMTLLKEKIKMRIFEPSMALYSYQWFIVPKKFGALKFIQDMHLVNKVKIRKKGSGLIVDETIEAFVGRTIYSIRDLYLIYNQFQLAIKSKDLTMMKT